MIRRIIAGERPSRPSGGKELGLSDELWELVRSAWAHEVGERPSLSEFVDLLKEATPDIAVLEELTEFDASSEEDVKELRYMFEYGDNTLLGMREEETLILIEVFDRASPPTHWIFTASQAFLTLVRFRFLIPYWMTLTSVVCVYTGFREFPLAAVFYRRAFGSPTEALQNQTVLPLPQGGCLIPPSGWLTGSWWQSRLSVLTMSRTSIPSSGYALLLLKTSLLNSFSFVGSHRDCA